ncbi:MAG: Nif3-like dinuclear metal center hexameric protein [Clostridiales bacterium]|nr:Nif3-like dinuclear metal center hexameric protein [Clostridiales bacterium]
MSTTAKDIYEYIDSIAPFDAQEDWDNAGFLIGDIGREIKRAVLSLDVSGHALSFAKEHGAQLIISHHPVIFGSISRVMKNSVVYKCIENNIDVLSAHTNFDLAENGINAALAQRLGLKNTRHIAGTYMTVGELESPRGIDSFAAFVKDALGVSGIRYTKTGKTIKTVAVIGGAAGEFYELAEKQGADCYITGEVQHHIMLACAENDFAIIEAGHFETESESFKMLLGALSEKFKGVEFLWAGDENPVHTI